MSISRDAALIFYYVSTNDWFENFVYSKVIYEDSGQF